MLMAETRKKKTPDIMRDILALDIKALMEREFSDEDNKPLALAKRTGLSLSSIQRTLEASTDASVDTIETLALALNVSPYQLLLPELDIENPQIVAGVTLAEQRLYARLRVGERPAEYLPKENPK